MTSSSKPVADAPVRPLSVSEQAEALRERAHTLIPGGAHTYAKGDDQYPVGAPPFIARGKGCRVWDLDGREFVEYGMGLRSVTLGHAFEPVVEAAAQAMRDGSNFSRPSPLEVTCAEELLSLIDGADMVKFAKNGSDVTTAAVKLARAATGRDLVAICRDQPFFSVDDWFIGATAMPAGIPRSVRALTLGFQYNDLDSVDALFRRHPQQIAALVLEPAAMQEPAPGFLEGLRDRCRREGTVLIFDETITGFRWHVGGAQKLYGVVPDLSTFGKALANGFSLAALAGRRELMELGGLRHDKERVFLLSTTHGAETHTLAAAIETMRVYRREDVVGTLHRQGARLRAGVAAAARELGLQDHFVVLGRDCNLVYSARDASGAPSQAFRTLVLQETIRRGVLMPSLIVSFAHGDADIDRTVEAIRGALEIYRRALESGVESFLEGRPVKPVFRPRN
ncbi:MAG TPA: glutamate-1-semialdehyde 2,1-aminomutase [Thermoanaerobaculia bacterium]|nr:glutamate-1-semialdehyde 2,1-aminomutase [Thermoanaerobaculia bacterium]